MKPPVLIERNEKEEEIRKELESYGFDEIYICDPKMEAIIDATFEKDYGYCVAGSFLDTEERLEEFMQIVSEIDEAGSSHFPFKVLPALPKACTKNQECIKKIVSDGHFLPPVIDGMYHPCEIAASIAKDYLLYEEKNGFQKKNAPVYYGNGVTYYPDKGYIDYRSLRIPIDGKKGKLFLYLLENMGSTVSKNALFELLELPSMVSLRVLVSKLKETIEKDFNIYNLRNIGYGLEPKGGISPKQKKEIVKELH